MAILNFEGFDDWPLVSAAAVAPELWKRGYIESGSGVSTNSSIKSGGRYGTGKYYSCYDGLGVFHFSSPSYVARPQIAIGFAFRFPTGTGTFTVTGEDTANAALVLTISATSNTYSVSYNPAGTANDITVTGVALPAAINIKAWTYLELRCSASVFEFALNGTVVYTKVFTANTDMDGWRIAPGTNIPVDLDDIYVSDIATFLGERVVTTLAPTNTVSNTGFLVGAATAHEALASDDGDTSYVWFSDVEQKVIVDVANLPLTPTTIDAVRVRRTARKTGTVAVPERLIAVTASENFIETGTSVVGPEYLYRQAIMQTDPADALAWSKAKVDGMQIGIKRGS